MKDNVLVNMVVFQPVGTFKSDQTLQLNMNEIRKELHFFFLLYNENAAFFFYE